MATCLCKKQPCEKHKFPVATKEDWVTFGEFLKELQVPKEVIEEMERT